MFKSKVKKEKRQRRHSRVRAKIAGTAKCPRLNVFKSNRFLYVQLIDDEKASTLVSGDSREIKGEQIAFSLGELVGKEAVKKGIRKCVFDRGGFEYTGNIKEIADGARSGGLKF